MLKENKSFKSQTSILNLLDGHFDLLSKNTRPSQHQQVVAQHKAEAASFLQQLLFLHVILLLHEVPENNLQVSLSTSHASNIIIDLDS